MPEAKMTFIIEAKDETKKAIDSASKNLEKIKQSAGVSSRGVQLPLRDNLNIKSEIRIRQAIIHIERARNVEDNKFNLKSLSDIQNIKNERNKLNQNAIRNIFEINERKNILRVEIIKSIPLQIIGERGIAGAGTGGLAGDRRSLLNQTQGDGSGLLTSAGKTISPLAFGAGALLGIVMTVAGKIANAYQKNIMQGMPLSGVAGVGNIGFYAQGTSPVSREEAEQMRKRGERITELQTQIVQQEQLNREKHGWFRRTFGAETAEEKRIKELKKEKEELEKTQKKVVKDINERVEKGSKQAIGVLSSYGLTIHNARQMEFEALRTGGLGLGTRGITTGKSPLFEQVAGYARAVGIEPEQAAQMFGTIQRFRGNFSDVVRYGQVAGFKGAMNVEFVQLVTEAVREGVTQGFAGTPEEIAKSIAMMTNIRDVKGQAIGVDRGVGAFRSVLGLMRSAAGLQGGNIQEFLLRTTIDRLQQESANADLSPSALLEKAIAELENPSNMGRVMSGTMQALKGMTGEDRNLLNIFTKFAFNQGIETARALAGTNWEEEQKRLNTTFARTRELRA
ncbi:MAG: hypothetical protein SNJ64_03270, partial [Endomicrobiia bacterium]